MTCRRLLNNRVNRLFAHSGKVFGNNTHNGTHYQAHNNGIKHIDARKLVTAKAQRFGQHPFNNKERSYCCDDY
ncbi:hypothetical protein D3C72_1903590 [compost metagenome]